MQARRLGLVLLGLALAAAALPGVAADHLDEEGDSQSYAYVDVDDGDDEETDRCTDPRRATAAVQAQLLDEQAVHAPVPAVQGGVCTLLDDGRYRVTVTGPLGVAAPFTASVQTLGQTPCGPVHDVVGTVEVTVPSDPELVGCAQLVVEVSTDAPRTGTIAIERIG